jgi:hypothetical protein
MLILSVTDTDLATDDNKDSADAAASSPATPSKNADDSSIVRVKRSISESEEANVAKVMKV